MDKMSVRYRARIFALPGSANGAPAVFVGDAGGHVLVVGDEHAAAATMREAAESAMHATRKAFARRVVRALRERSASLRSAGCAQAAMAFNEAAAIVEEMAGIRSKEKR